VVNFNHSADCYSSDWHYTLLVVQAGNDDEKDGVTAHSISKQHCTPNVNS